MKIMDIGNYKKIIRFSIFIILRGYAIFTIFLIICYFIIINYIREFIKRNEILRKHQEQDLQKSK